jgi:hypothetical protein
LVKITAEVKAEYDKKKEIYDQELEEYGKIYR